MPSFTFLSNATYDNNNFFRKVRNSYQNLLIHLAATPLDTFEGAFAPLCCFNTAITHGPSLMMCSDRSRPLNMTLAFKPSGVRHLVDDTEPVCVLQGDYNLTVSLSVRLSIRPSVSVSVFQRSHGESSMNRARTSASMDQRVATASDVQVLLSKSSPVKIIDKGKKLN